MDSRCPCQCYLSSAIAGCWLASPCKTKWGRLDSNQHFACRLLPCSSPPFAGRRREWRSWKVLKTGFLFRRLYQLGYVPVVSPRKEKVARYGIEPYSVRASGLQPDSRPSDFFPSHNRTRRRDRGSNPEGPFEGARPLSKRMPSPAIGLPLQTNRAGSFLSGSCPWCTGDSPVYPRPSAVQAAGFLVSHLSMYFRGPSAQGGSGESRTLTGISPPGSEPGASTIPPRSHCAVPHPQMAGGPTRCTCCSVVKGPGGHRSSRPQNAKTPSGLSRRGFPELVNFSVLLVQSPPPAHSYSHEDRRVVVLVRLERLVNKEVIGLTFRSVGRFEVPAVPGQ